MTVPDAARNFWMQRAPRERVVLSAGAIITLLALGWALLWLPAEERAEAAQARVSAQQETLQQLRALQTLKAKPVVQPNAANATGSAASRADRGLRMAGLAASIRRIEPGNDGSVSVTLEQAAFDDLMDWLADAPAQYGLQAEALEATVADRPGAVNVRMRLRDASRG